MKRAYLDHNATTPLRPEARKAVLRALEIVGNPSSVHSEGRAARALIETARREVAVLSGAKAAEVIFTSGGTEAARLAFHAAKAAQGVERLIVSAIEHDAVLASAEASGLAVEMAPVDGDGQIDLNALARLLAASNKRVLVALMLANNETGVIHPVSEAAALAHKSGGLLLCDAVQAAGKVPLDFAALGADMMMLGGHKIGAPLGVGALIVREGLPFAADAVGGGQEMRRRAGSENVSGIAGFGAAACEACEALGEFAALANLRDKMETRLAAAAPDAVFFGQDAARLPNTSYIAAPGLDAATLLMALDLDGIAVSAGAACSSGKVGHPRVLEAMNIDPTMAKSAVRVSLGWSSEPDDIVRFIESWLRVYERNHSKTREFVNAGGEPSSRLAAVES